MMRSILIEILNQIDPIQDHRWVPEGENQWFLPCFLDLKNQTYSGYWYTSEKCIEDEHSHTGISQGIMLYGRMELLCDDKKYIISENQTFFVPPNTLHSGELIPEDKGYLNFGTVVGRTDYPHEKLDVNTYYESVKSHYKKHGLSFDHLINQ